MFEWFTRLVLRYRVALLLSLLGLTVVMFIVATNVKLTYDGIKILPNDDPDFVQYQEFKKQFGEDAAVLVLGFQSQYAWSYPVYNDWYDLGLSIKNIDGIQEVLSTARSYYLQRNDSSHTLQLKLLPAKAPTGQEDVDKIKSEFMKQRFYSGLLYNADSNTVLMAITFDQHKLNSKNRIDIVELITERSAAFATKHQLDVHYSGLPYVRTAVMKKISAEMKLFSLLAILVTAGILLIFFRSFQAVIFPLIVVIIAVIWSMASMVIFGFKISILTSLIPTLLIIIGIPNSILFLNRYQQEFAKHGNKVKALSRSIQRIGTTTFFANITTSIGFIVFAFTGSDTLTEFGIVASFNTMLTWLISLIFIPIVFSFLPPPNTKQVSHLDRKSLTKFLDGIVRLVTFHRSKVYITVVTMLVISIYGITKISKVSYVVDDLPKDDVIYTDLKFFERNFKGVIPFEIAVDTKKPGGALSPQTLQKINALQKKVLQYPEFSKPVSVVELIKFSYQGLNDNEPNRYILPNIEELGRLSSYAGLAKGNQRLFRSIIDSTKQMTRISFQMQDVGNQKVYAIMNELKPRIDSVFPPDQYNVKITGSSLMFLKNNDYLQKNLRESILMAILLIASVMFLLFLSLRMSFFAIVPSLVPLFFTAAIMGFTGIALKPSTILIFSIAFGIASDGTMYFLTKYRQELRANSGSISKTVTLAIHETGPSMLYTAVILFCGFFVFTVSSFGGTSSLGVLISITLLIAMLSNLIFLPCLLLSFERRIISKAFLQEPLVQLYDEDEDLELDDLEIKKEIEN